MSAVGSCSFHPAPVVTMPIPERSFDAQETAALLDHAALLAALRQTVLDYDAGRVVSPARLVAPLRDGGLMLSMPSCADDLAIHKLINVCPGNAARGLPTIHGQVTACDARSGQIAFVLDGPTVTGRRTATMTALGIDTLCPRPPRDILLIGTGMQAAYHAEALGALFPHATLYVRSRHPDDARRFASRHRAAAPTLRALEHAEIPASVDVVVTLTTSKTPVYTDPARAERLVIGVGAFTPDAAEIAPQTVRDSRLVVDDPAGARHEAGDLIQAGVAWETVSALATRLKDGNHPAGPWLFKSVGCAAWDLAACRVAHQALG
jgi:1-piperideine-2-carboxylate/1-pyrroline-2-carboxylate reductase [NAD(P)H]